MNPQLREALAHWGCCTMVKKKTNLGHRHDLLFWALLIV
jgi:hypothetical protein